MINFTNKQTLVNVLKTQIATRDNQAIKALITVYNNQTSSEQYEENTHVHNGVGFTPADAEFMSSLAKQYLNKGYLSQKQMYFVKKHMPKYANQLINQSIEIGKIVKEGSNYVWNKDTISYKHQNGDTYQMSNIPSTDPDNDWEEEYPNSDIYWRNKFAEEERKQEERAFLSDPDYCNYIGA